MEKRPRLLAWLAALLAAVMFFSALYVALEADHDCDGENCTICAQIGACEDLLRQPGACLAALALALFACYLAPAAEKRGETAPALPTPVTLKVKLSN